jgi:HAD superfamily hydrolase (TIGR01509 family)
MVRLRSGVLELVDSARAQGLQLAIATTTSPVNIAALLRAARGPLWRDDFRIIEDATTAPHKKPHPQVYLQVLQRLQLPAAACMAFEDSANGLLAAHAAGLATIVTPTRFTAHHDLSLALRVLPSLEGVDPDQLRIWHAQVATVMNA